MTTLRKLAQFFGYATTSKEEFEKPYAPLDVDKATMSTTLVHTLLEACVQTNPCHIALDFEGSATMTYSELDVLSTALALELRARGVKPETLVPLMFSASFEMIIAILAVIKSGGAYVPLDAEHPPARLEHVLRLINANLVLCGKEEAISNRIAEIQKSLPDLVVLDYHHADKLGVEASQRQALPQVIDPKNLAYVIFTSGSTGTPKGVAVEHGNLAAVLNLGQGNAARRPNMRRLLVSPYTFDCSVGDIFSTLTTGGTLGLVNRPKLLSNLPHWLEVMKATHVAVTPSIARQIPVDGLPHLQHLLLAGETLPVDLAYKLSRNHTVMNIMGPTECTVDVTEYVIPKGSSFESSQRVPIGQPGRDAQIYILRPETNERVSPGEEGEICIGGPQVARGYFNDPELTKAKFVPDCFSTVPGARMFRTADLGRWNGEGQLEHLGRFDGQVKLRGLRIETGEIETVVSQSDRGIGAVYVDVLDIRGEQALVAVLEQPRTGTEQSDDGPNMLTDIADANVIEHAKANCAKYLPCYMTPSVWLSIARFPQSDVGKLDRKKLRAAAQEHVSTKLSIDLRAAPRPPQTKEESLILPIISHILDIPLAEVVLDASFIQHGGNSLQAMMLTAALQEHGMAANIPEYLDDSKTIAMLVAGDQGGKINAESDTDEEYAVFSLAPRGWEDAVMSVGLRLDEVEDVYPVQTMARDWVELALDNDGKAMIVEYHYDLGKDIDAARFTWAWEQLRLREPELRTVFVKTNEREEKMSAGLPRNDIIAVVVKGNTPRGATLDVLSTTGDEMITRLLAEHRVQFGQVPIRSWLVHDGSTEKWRFTSSRHHSLHDARTLDTLGFELSALYHKGESVFAAIEAKKTIRHSFGAFMHSITRPNIVVNQQTFWRRYLDGIGPAIWPSPDDVLSTFCMKNYGIHVGRWIGSLQNIAKAIGVTKGALLRGAFGMTVADKEERSETLVFELTNWMSDESLTPYGYCTDLKPTRIQSHPELNSEAQRFVAIARDANRSHAETLPNIGLGWNMAVDILGPQVAPGHSFATAGINIIDMTVGNPQEDGVESSGNLLANLILQEMPVASNLPLYVDARIMKDIVILGCAYDPTVVKREEAEAFVERQIDFLDGLTESMGGTESDKSDGSIHIVA